MVVVVVVSSDGDGGGGICGGVSDRDGWALREGGIAYMLENLNRFQSHLFLLP